MVGGDVGTLALELWSWEIRAEISDSRDVAGAGTREYELFAKWRRRESNPRPKTVRAKRLHA
jgi:hypothetical protein